MKGFATLLVILTLSAANDANTAATVQTVTTSLQSNGEIPPVHEPIDPYLATPAPGHIYEIPVVIMRFLPTSDGVNLDVSKTPDYWNLGPISLEALKAKIDVFDKRIKFMLEEGSRFRGYKTPSAPPSIGYRVVEYITVYEQTPAGPILEHDNGFPLYAPDYNQIFARFNMEHYVNDLGVKEIWVWQGTVTPSFPSYDPDLHQPEDFRLAAESNMSSPLTGDISNSYRLNNDLPVYNSTYTVYGQNIRRTQAEAVHNHGHQLEVILKHVDRLQHGNTDLFWQNFVGTDENGSHITGRAGWTHMPPNTTKHYDYTQNTTLVESDIEDWTPDNSGSKKLFNVDTYGNLTYPWPDSDPTTIPQRVESQWYIYWMQNMPGHGNRIQYEDRYLTNWWIFTTDWDTAIADDIGLVSQYPPGDVNDSSSQNAAPLASRNIADVLVDPMVLKTLDRTALEVRLEILRSESDGSLKYIQAIALIENLLAAIRPDKTVLLANYPNPFNPETWIPYHLANGSDVAINIYDSHGGIVRRLDLGHQQEGYYTSRARAVYWDGTNDFGERVSSGIYFYQLEADNMSRLRKMVILK